MGRYYAQHSAENDVVADAIAEHYKPLGPGDSVPTAPISYVVALADKIDSLVTLWRAGEEPTGSKDPFALRRAGLGIIRIVLENRLRLPLRLPMLAALAINRPLNGIPWADRRRDALSSESQLKAVAEELKVQALSSPEPDATIVAAVLTFLADRLKVALRDKGTRYDLIDAVFSLRHDDDLVRLVARVDALQAFLASDDGANLLVAYRRAANILKAEEKKDGTVYAGEPDPDAFTLPEEKAMFVELAAASELVAAELERERFGEAMGVMARLRRHVDAFFEKVTVNDKDAARRKNRLLLLSLLRATLHQVADFSKIEG